MIMTNYDGLTPTTLLFNTTVQKKTAVFLTSTI